MAPLPLAKIGKEVIKFASKPLAKRIKVEAARYDWAQVALIGVGQRAHHVTTRLTNWAEGTTVESIPPLEKSAAIQDGADLLGEAIVLTVAVGAVVWEYDHSSKKSKAKEEARLRDMEAKDDEMVEQLHSLDLRIEALEKAVAAQSALFVGRHQYTAPAKEELKAIPRKSDFVEIDADGDGKVTLREFVSRYEKSIPKERLEELFAEADKDGNGTLSFNEFLKVARKLERVGSGSPSAD